MSSKDLIKQCVLSKIRSAISNFIVLFDACVLYPAPLRDFLMNLAITDLFRAKWTDEIHDEWIRSLLKNRADLAKERLYRIRDLMNSNVRDCLVSGYQDLIPSLTLPDENDRHVLAAAICTGADVIVTYNLSDFPAVTLGQYGIEAQHPDEFINHLLDLAPSIICEAVKRQRMSLKNPPLSVEELLAAYEKQNLAKTVAVLRLYNGLL
ncbi:PIN domain-containing protein [Altericista sp. CCNU0014]|uniref:PIN domain-containing protein n=1 Tax=Altericista sp. CCNU0014 TaxID=3082949 RepID=UPI00384CAB44